MLVVYRHQALLLARPTRYIRGHEYPMFITTFDGLTLPYGELGL